MSGRTGRRSALALQKGIDATCPSTGISCRQGGSELAWGASENSHVAQTGGMAVILFWSPESVLCYWQGCLSHGSGLLVENSVEASGIDRCRGHGNPSDPGSRVRALHPIFLDPVYSLGLDSLGELSTTSGPLRRRDPASQPLSSRPDS